jgi:hypothetical protein
MKVSYLVILSVVLLLHFCFGYYNSVPLADLLKIAYDHQIDGAYHHVFIHYNGGKSQPDWDNHLHVVYTPVGTYATIKVVSHKINGMTLKSGSYGFNGWGDDTRRLEQSANRFDFPAGSVYKHNNNHLLDESLQMLNSLRFEILDSSGKPIKPAGPIRTPIKPKQQKNQFELLSLDESESSPRGISRTGSFSGSQTSPRNRPIRRAKSMKQMGEQSPRQESRLAKCWRCIAGVCSWVYNCFTA